MNDTMALRPFLATLIGGVNPLDIQPMVTNPIASDRWLRLPRFFAAIAVFLTAYDAMALIALSCTALIGRLRSVDRILGHPCSKKPRQKARFFAMNCFV